MFVLCMDLVVALVALFAVLLPFYLRAPACTTDPGSACTTDPVRVYNQLRILLTR